MTPDKILAHYKWNPGDCFRCALTHLYVTRIDTITTPSGDDYALDACGSCVLAMEEERRRHAERRGERYEPGELGS